MSDYDSLLYIVYEACLRAIRNLLLTSPFCDTYLGVYTFLKVGSNTSFRNFNSFFKSLCLTFQIPNYEFENISSQKIFLLRYKSKVENLCDKIIIKNVKIK